jgi:hypothetical protein
MRHIELLVIFADGFESTRATIRKEVARTAALSRTVDTPR